MNAMAEPLLFQQGDRELVSFATRLGRRDPQHAGRACLALARCAHRDGGFGTGKKAKFDWKRI